MTTPAATTRLRFLPAAVRTRRGFGLGFLATLLVGLALLAGASMGVAISHANRVMPGVSVGGVDIGGLDRAAAAARLEAQLPALSDAQSTEKLEARS